MQLNGQRRLRLVPVALIMYTISYVDRTDIALALDPGISTMMKDLVMDDRLKGQAAGIFFLGYVLLQVPGGYLGPAIIGEPKSRTYGITVPFGVLGGALLAAAALCFLLRKPRRADASSHR